MHTIAISIYMVLSYRVIMCFLYTYSRNILTGHLETAVSKINAHTKKAFSRLKMLNIALASVCILMVLSYQHIHVW